MNINKLILLSAAISLNAMATIAETDLKPLNLPVSNINTLKPASTTGVTPVFKKDSGVTIIPVAIADPDKTIKVQHGIAFVESAKTDSEGYYKGDVLSDDMGNSKVVSGNIKVHYEGNLNDISSTFDLIVIKDFGNNVALVKPRNEKAELKDIQNKLIQTAAVKAARVELLGSTMRAF
ncbi:hypothetical protein [Pseudoalteromonas piscicida]|uniref:Uncharacterized protein n=1 Tax=Pseudoalteromonas piscicida TaxID=43662 RepID=A0A2A5JQU8_PSEO7|nr:hypothetical protein [Pseudoalteromonas piscicida]PCK31796.1 hypothetical protein CEX98_10465 [Pseudoalteromonas piscicida]